MQKYVYLCYKILPGENLEILKGQLSPGAQGCSSVSSGGGPKLFEAKPSDNCSDQRPVAAVAHLAILTLLDIPGPWPCSHVSTRRADASGCKRSGYV